MENYFCIPIFLLPYSCSLSSILARTTRRKVIFIRHSNYWDFIPSHTICPSTASYLRVLPPNSSSILKNKIQFSSGIQHAISLYFQKATNRRIFLCSLSVFSIVLVVSTHPLPICLHHSHVSIFSLIYMFFFTGHWAFGRVLCHLVPFAQGISVYVSTLTLTSIAVDRFFVIIYPFRPRMKLSTCIAIIIAIWAFAILITLPYCIYMFQKPIDGKYYCEEQWPVDIVGMVSTIYRHTLLYIKKNSSAKRK